MIKQALASSLTVFLVTMSALAYAGTEADANRLNYNVEVAHASDKKNNYQSIIYGYKGTYATDDLMKSLSVNTVILGFTYDFQ